MVEDIRWAVVKTATDNGVRIGMEMADETLAPEGALLATGLSEEEAVARCKALAEELGIPEFDNAEDTFLGYAE